MAKLLAAVLLSLAVAAAVSTSSMVRTAEAAMPILHCAKNGEALPAGATQYNTVLVKLWYYDKTDQPITKLRYRLVRISQKGKHIPVADVMPKPGCYVLVTGLPNFTHKPLTLCVVVRGNLKAVHDPEYISRSPACAMPVLDGLSGLYTYKFFVQKV